MTVIDTFIKERKDHTQLPSSRDRQEEMAALRRSKKRHAGDTRTVFSGASGPLAFLFSDKQCYIKIRYYDELYMDTVMSKIMAEH